MLAYRQYKLQRGEVSIHLLIRRSIDWSNNLLSRLIDDDDGGRRGSAARGNVVVFIHRPRHSGFACECQRRPLLDRSAAGEIPQKFHVGPKLGSEGVVFLLEKFPFHCGFKGAVGDGHVVIGGENLLACLLKALRGQLFWLQIGIPYSR